MSRTGKRVILGHHVTVQKGLNLHQHHDRHTVMCTYTQVGKIVSVVLPTGVYINT